MDQINKDKLKELGSNWKILNEKYDNEIIELIDSPEPTIISPEKFQELRKMQDEIFDLEVEIYNILQSK